MPRVTFVKKARKDNKAAGIKKGDSYFWWAFMQGGRGGAKRYSKTKPKPSQLTQSEFWGAVYGLQESYESPPVDIEDLESNRDDIVSQLEEIRDETQGKYDNMPEGLQQGDSGQLLEERVNSLDEAISEIESVDLDFDVPEKEEKETTKDYDARVEEEKQSFVDEKWGEISDALQNISCS